MQSFERTGVVPASPEEVFDAWVSAEGHAAMTDAPATSDPQVGGRFQAWGGFISGTYTVLDRPHRLAFRWRTIEFDADAEDSLVSVSLAPAGDGYCKLVIRHRGIPDGQPDYDQGWVDHYLDPMNRHWG